MISLALSIASCSPRVADTCPHELDRALDAARDHDQTFENAHAFKKVTPTDCRELLGEFSKKYHAIFRACEEVVRRAEEKEAEEAKRRRAAERAQWCEGADIPQPN